MNEHINKIAEKILISLNNPENVSVEYINFQNDNPLVSRAKTNKIKYTDIIASSVLDKNDEFISIIYYKERGKEYKYTFDEKKINEIINSHTSDYFKYKFRKNPKYLKAILDNKDDYFQKLSLNHTDIFFNNIKTLESYFNLNNDIERINNNISYEQIYFIFLKNDIDGFLNKNKENIKSFYDKKEFEKIKKLLIELNKKNNLIDMLKNETYEKLIDVIQTKECKRNFNLIAREFNKKQLSLKILNLLDDFSRFGIKHNEFKDYFSKKISSYKTEDVILNSLNLFFYNFKKWNVSEIEEKIIDLGLDIIDNKHYKMVEIENFEQSREIGSNLWCISTDENNFNHYKSNGNRQYFVYDFTKEKDDALSFFGITVDSMGKIESAHDRYDECILKNEILEDFKFKKLDKKYFLDKGKRVSETIIDMADANVLDVLDDYLDECYKKGEKIDHYLMLKSIYKKKYNNYSFKYPKKLIEEFSKDKKDNFNNNEKEMYLKFLNICKKNNFNIKKLFDNALNKQEDKLNFLMSNDKEMRIFRKENNDIILEKIEDEIKKGNINNLYYGNTDNFINCILKNKKLINMVDYKNGNILEMIVKKMDNNNEFIINGFLKKLDNKNKKILELKVLNNEGFNGFQFLDKSILENFNLQGIKIKDYFEIFNGVNNTVKNQEFIIKILKRNSPNEKLSFSTMSEIASIQKYETRKILIQEEILKEKDYLTLIDSKLIELDIEDINFSKNVFKYCGSLKENEIIKYTNALNRYVYDLLDKDCNMSKLESYMGENYKYIESNLKNIINNKNKQKKLKW